MKYLGSKNRISKYITPIIIKSMDTHKLINYIEPFVGGGNMIDKIPKRFNRVGYDYNGHVIQSLIDIRDEPENLLEEFSKEERDFYKNKSPKKYYSHACIVTSFGADLNGGYAREAGSNDSTFCGYGKRNALKQSPNLKGCIFKQADYINLDFKNSLIYCDPPYRNSTGYGKIKFNHDIFYEWCRKQSLNNIIYISEYDMPDDFIEVWRGEIKTNLSSQRSEATHTATEKLFTLL